MLTMRPWNIVLLAVILLTSQLDVAAGVSAVNVSLSSGTAFAQLHSATTLLCQYELVEGETVQKLGWFRAGVPVMTWIPPEAPVGGVEFRDRLNLSDGNNGSLVFPKVTVEDGGPYTCTVQSSEGKQGSSDLYNLAVADVPTEGFSMQGNVADCILHFSFSSPPIYPKPTPMCGVWSSEALYTSSATDWQAVPYYNGSVAYSIADTTFPVRSMPLQAGIRCELSFPPSEGSSDDDRIIAWTSTAYYSQVSERGCPALEVGDGMAVHYNNHRTTCRGELTLQDPEKQLVAMISCMPGTRSSLRGGAMSSLQLQCAGGGQWEPVGGIRWDEFEDMECSADPNAPAVEESTEASASADLQEEPVAEPEGGAAAAGLSATLCVTAALLTIVRAL